MSCSVCRNSCCTCSRKSTASSFCFKFAGIIPPTATAAVGFVADDAVDFLSLTPLNYPVPEQFVANRLGVNLQIFVPAVAVPIKVELLRDGIPVPGFEVNYGGGDPGSGTTYTNALPANFFFDQTFDLRVTTEGLLDPMTISAVLTAGFIP